MTECGSGNALRTLWNKGAYVLQCKAQRKRDHVGDPAHAERGGDELQRLQHQSEKLLPTAGVMGSAEVFVLTSCAQASASCSIGGQVL